MRLAEEGKVEEAIAAYQQAQQLDPEIDLNPETKNIDKDPQAVIKWAASAKVSEGVRLAREGKVEEAIANFNKAIQLNPKNSSAYYHRGNAYVSLENYQDALADYTQAIKINPTDANASPVKVA